MGFNVATFQFILDHSFELTWNTTHIPRDDAPATRAPHISHRSLNAAGALGLILHFLNSTMQDVSLMEIFGLVPATVSHYINFSLEILLATLQKLCEAQVQWPKGTEYTELNNHLFSEPTPHWHFWNVGRLKFVRPGV